jgi:hypothetical protein
MDLGFRVKYPKRHGIATQSGIRAFANLLDQKDVNSINQVRQADMAHYLYGRVSSTQFISPMSKAGRSLVLELMILMLPIIMRRYLSRPSSKPSKVKA